MLSKISDGSCSCSPGYVCACFNIPKKKNGNKRGYLSTVERESVPKKASDLMTTKLVPGPASVNLFNQVKGIPCCKARKCLKNLFGGVNESGCDNYEGIPHFPSCGFGPAFLDAVVSARHSVYQKNQDTSMENLNLILFKDTGNIKYGCTDYKFYHNGLLGDSPGVPVGIPVSYKKI